ncbi:hypothetical protein [Halobacillus sp. H74]|uniref:hypothetical protein n=1 Tax=Halobacillus sp. H74 TaxID=3457436 RepID=UPI003FCDB76C
MIKVNGKVIVNGEEKVFKNKDLKKLVYGEWDVIKIIDGNDPITVEKVSGGRTLISQEYNENSFNTYTERPAYILQGIKSALVVSGVVESEFKNVEIKYL